MSAPKRKKRLGQHHLKDGALCRPLLDYLNLRSSPGQTLPHILEIGPGGGILTAELLAAGARVTACEVDLEWAFHLLGLRRQYPDQLHLAAWDALAVDWARMPTPTYAAGNLPFQVATKIIENLLLCHVQVPRAAFMVQKEVGERLVATPGTSAYGSLSVLVRACTSDARYLGTVKPGSFQPPPKVSAAFIGLVLQPPPLPPGELPDFFKLVRLAFAKRRKTLRNSLSSGLGREHADKILTTLGWDANRRAEALDLDDFLELYRVFSSRRD